jgi:subtilisin family serine protease
MRISAVCVVALALLLAVGIAAEPRIGDDAHGAAKRLRSPVDARLRGWAGAPGRLRAGPTDPWPMVVREDGIVIEAASNGDPVALLAELTALGLRHGTRSGNLVSGVLPFEAVGALATCRHLAVARPTLVTTQSELTQRGQLDRARGSVVSQGVAAMQVDRLPRSARGVGTSVGILADSFDCGGGERARDTQSGDLPAEVVILDDTNSASCADEGRALAQIVHDASPYSRIGFHTGFNGQADFAEGVRELAREFGADVILDDVLFFDEPFFQDGVIARAIDDVHDQGVVYVAAAGNSGRRAYDAPFRDSGATGFYEALGRTRRHDFDPGPGVDVFERVTLPPFGETILVLQWDESFVSASTAQPPVGAASDYDLIVYRNEAPRPQQFADVFAISDEFNVGRDPLEVVQLTNPSAAPLDVYLAIERFSLPGFDGPDALHVKIIDFGSRIEREWGTGGATSFGHANARGAISVGAAAWFDTPRFGVSPPLAEPFSSAGGVPILIDAAGVRLPEPELRETPDLVAPDGVNTTFYPAPGDIPEDDDAFPNAFGSSIAAPHVAGVAALLQGRAGRVVSPNRIEELLEAGAIDMAEPGYDPVTGHGLIDARDALFRLIGRD